MSKPMAIEKLHGAENDFLFIPRSALPSLALSRLRTLARRICHRRRGLGADGLVVWETTPGRVSLLILNSDGSVAGTCGNALRCLGLLCLEHQTWNGSAPLPVFRLVPSIEDAQELAPDETFALRAEPFATLASGTPLGSGQAIVSVVMGQERHLAVDAPGTQSLLPVLEARFPHRFRPSFEDPACPSDDTHLEERHPLEHVRIDLSNPHWVFASPAFASFTERDFVAFGELAQGELRTAAPEGKIPLCNIGMVCGSEVESDEHSPTFRLVVFERGAGLTPCCGSGATAARVALEALGYVSIDTDAVSFEMPGGTVAIRWTDDAPLLRVLVGPAERAARLEISSL